MSALGCSRQARFWGILIGRPGKNIGSQERTEQEALRRPRYNHQRELERRLGRVRNPHRMAARLCLGQSLQLPQDSPDCAVTHVTYEYNRAEKSLLEELGQ